MDSLEEIRLTVTRLEGKVDGLTQLVVHYQTQVTKIEGRLWGLAVGFLGTLVATIVGLLK